MVEVLASVFENVVVGIEKFFAGQIKIYPDYMHFFIGHRCAVQNISVGVYNLALAHEVKRFHAIFHSHSISGDGIDPVFQAAGDHSLWAMGQD